MRRKTVHYLVHADNTTFICGTAKGDYSEEVAAVTCRKCLTIMAEQTNQAAKEHMDMNVVREVLGPEIVDEDPFGVGTADPETKDPGNPDFNLGPMDLTADIPSPVVAEPAKPPFKQLSRVELGIDMPSAAANRAAEADTVPAKDVDSADLTAWKNMQGVHGIANHDSPLRKGGKKGAYTKSPKDLKRQAEIDKFINSQRPKRPNVHVMKKDHTPNKPTPGVVKRAEALAAKGRVAPPRNRPIKEPQVCLCGCKGMTKGGMFLPGHDARYHSAQRKLETQKGKAK